MRETLLRKNAQKMSFQNNPPNISSVGTDVRNSQEENTETLWLSHYHLSVFPISPSVVVPFVQLSFGSERREKTTEATKRNKTIRSTGRGSQVTGARSRSISC